MSTTPSPSSPPGATEVSPGRGAPARPSRSAPSVRPRRTLPGGRAVVGAFLVVLSAVGVFAAYLTATAAPSTRYLVAGDELLRGAVLDERVLGALPIDLPDPVAATAFTVEQLGQVEGRVLLTPVAEGGLIRAGDLADEDAGTQGVTVSFPVPASRAIGGAIRVNETVDVIATYPAEAQGLATTGFVVRDATVVAIGRPDDTLAGSEVTLTVEVDELAAAQRVVNALDVAELAVVRGGTGQDTPPPTSGTGLLLGGPAAADPSSDDVGAAPQGQSEGDAATDQDASEPAEAEPSADASEG